MMATYVSLPRAESLSSSCKHTILSHQLQTSSQSSAAASQRDVGNETENAHRVLDAAPRHSDHHRASPHLLVVMTRMRQALPLMMMMGMMMAVLLLVVVVVVVLLLVLLLLIPLVCRDRLYSDVLVQ